MRRTLLLALSAVALAGCGGAQSVASHTTTRASYAPFQDALDGSASNVITQSLGAR